MREIKDHIVENDAADHQLDIFVLDEPGAGGANHEYTIQTSGLRGVWKMGDVKFQNGPIATMQDVNGVTHEALLAIIIDRLRSFQAGPYSCRDNAIALTHLEDALMRLQRRTRERLARGVEGTLKQ